MSSVSLRDLETDPLALVRRVESGESILVLRDNRPVVEIRPAISLRKAMRPCGLAAGAFVVPVDFDAPLPDDVLNSFEGA